ncbi:MAG: hypothetical protein H0W96_03595 [Solirubrobacterales bacterium]|nr:hypothetical protein [Solirubrobacterales bacterium]
MKIPTLAALTTFLAMAASQPVYAQDALRQTYGGPGQVVTIVALSLAAPVTQGSSTLRVTPPAGPPAEVPPPAGGTENAPSAEEVGELPTPASGTKNATVATAPSGNSAIRNATVSETSLPFTGFDVLLMLLGGGVLGAVGVGMRRLTRRAV